MAATLPVMAAMEDDELMPRALPVNVGAGRKRRRPLEDAGTRPEEEEEEEEEVQEGPPATAEEYLRRVR